MENTENNSPVTPAAGNRDTKQIVGAIILAGAMIAGAILLRGSSAPVVGTAGNGTASNPPAAVTSKDFALGNENAKITVIEYADFQCPFCGAVSGFMPSTAPLAQALKQRDPNWVPFVPVLQEYVNRGEVRLVYRDFPFLGAESFQASEAARCAGDQGKFWDYHDYLYSHQQGENEGAFSDTKLKSFATTIGLKAAEFNTCLDSNKYEKAVIEAKNEAASAGVNGTPKAFIIKGKKVIATIDGAESGEAVREKIDAALK